MKLLVLILALAQTVEEVRVEGNRRLSADAVRGHAAITSAEDFPAAFQRLWATGLFEDVRFDRIDDVLVIHVEEKPILSSYRIEAEAVDRDELVKGLRAAGFDLRPNRLFGEDDARMVALLAQQFLGDEVEVRTHLTPLADARVELVVYAEPVPAQKVSSLDFVGNHILSNSELRRVMRLDPSGLTTRITGRHKLTRQILDSDLQSLRALYRSRGFRDVQVGPVILEPALRIPIFEGRQYHLESVEIEQGSLLSQEQAREWLPSVGELYDASVLDAVETRVERYYQSRGYPGSRVTREEKAVADQVRVLLRVDEGPFLRVGRIEFRGNRRHRDRDLRQQLDLEESERFNQQLVDRDAGALSRLETIARVVPEVDFTTRPGRADIIYHIEEVDPFEYLIGGGVNGIQGGTGNGQFIAKSLLGRGDMWRFDLDFGNRFQNFGVSYRDPSTLGHRLFMTVDFLRTDLTFPDDTSEETLDFALRVGGPQGRRLQLLGGFRFVQFTLDSTLDGFVPFLTPYIGQRFRTQRASGTLAYDSRDRPVFPTRGRGINVGVELVTGDVEATRFRAQITELVRLGNRRHLLSLSSRFEAVWSFGETGETAGLPRFERLFLGSENDMRGFAIRGVGPRDANIVVGGDRLFFTTAEYQFAAHPRLRFAGFFDLGNVWATDFEGLELPTLRYDIGAELQFLTPVWNIPLRFGYGLNLEPVYDENRGRFFFTLAIRF